MKQDAVTVVCTQTALEFVKTDKSKRAGEGSEGGG